MAVDKLTLGWVLVVPACHIKRINMAKMKGELICAVLFGVFLLAVADSDIYDFNTLVAENETIDVSIPTTEIEVPTEQVEITKGINIEDEFCPSPPEIEGAVSPVLDGTKHASGTVVSYQCPFGHVGSSSSNLLSTCRISDLTGKAEWTRPNVICIPRSCGDPGYVANGRRIGNLFTFPNKVEFKCNDGYRMRGLKDRYCQASGYWSGQIPVCEPIYCSVPQNPPNGRVIYSSLDYGSELRYECDKGFDLSHHQSRICVEDGKWSNSEPECKEIRCQVPEAPTHGSVQVTGDPVVGSLALYSCNDNTTLSGLSTLKCLPIGVWSSNPPKCLHFCKIPTIQNGELGRFQERNYRFTPKKEFKAFQVNENIPSGESVMIRCDNGYRVEEKSQKEIDEVICNNGSWSKALHCHKALCLQDPPHVEHAVPVILNENYRRNGAVIWYKCDKKNGYERAQNGTVKCKDGKWIGPTPVCAQFRCYTNQLNFVGLKKPKKAYFRNGTDFEVECETDYTESTENAKIACIKGKWLAKSNPCILNLNAQTCDKDPPPLSNGYSKIVSRDVGSFVDYECEDGYEKIGRSSVVCNSGHWTGQPPECNLSERGLEEVKASKSTNTDETSKRNSSQHQDECFCTYDYRTYSLNAYRESGILKKEDKVPKGEMVTFQCKFLNTNIVWKNRMRLSTTVTLTCNTCRDWQPDDLPDCQILQPGDSIVVLHSNVQILPGGFLEAPKSSNIILQCSNKWLQPRWNIKNQKRIAVLIDPVETRIRTGFFSEYVYITAVDHEHAGQYECLSTDYYKTPYVSTVVDLRIADSEVRCPFLQTVTKKGNFEIEYEKERRINSIVRYKCKDKSQNIVGASERKCMENGNWSGSFPTCEDSSDNVCPLLDEGNMFQIDYKSGKRVNDVAYYYCRSATQRLIGSSNRTCLYNGLWSGTEPTCEEITCLEFPVYNRLNVTYSNGTRVNSIARFSCAHPTSLVGVSSTTCDYSGNWKDPKPSCEMLDVRCPAIDGKGVFTIKYIGDKRINSTAQFFCMDDSKKVEGCNIMTCQPNGEWSGDYPTCVDYVNCEKFVPSTNLVVSYSDDVRVNSIATFRCAHSQILNGSTISTCLSNGSWSHPLPSCEIPKCSIDILMQKIPESVFPDLTDITDEYLNAGSELLLLCEDGLIFKGNPLATCGLNGTWELENVQCVPGCRLSHNRSVLIIEPVKNDYRFGESILLSCPPGMVLSNEVERLVCLGKTWSHEMPNCTEWKDTTPAGLKKTSRKSYT